MAARRVLSHGRARGPRRGERGAALLLAITLVLVIALAGAAILRIAGDERTSAAALGKKERGRACAEAGLQYGRRYFGAQYDVSHGWNDYLSNATPGYRFDPERDARPALADLPSLVFADLDSDGTSDVWVSIRDDDDEAPRGLPDDRARDNNEVVWLRAECVNPGWQVTQGGQQVNAEVEVLLSHIQGTSFYGTAQSAINLPDISGRTPPAP